MVIGLLGGESGPAVSGMPESVDIPAPVEHRERAAPAAGRRVPALPRLLGSDRVQPTGWCCSSPSAFRPARKWLIVVILSSSSSSLVVLVDEHGFRRHRRASRSGGRRSSGTDTVRMPSRRWRSSRPRRRPLVAHTVRTKDPYENSDWIPLARLRGARLDRQLAALAERRCPRLGRSTGARREPRRPLPSFRTLQRVSAFASLRPLFDSRLLKLEDEMKEGVYEVRAELPGVDPTDDIEVTVRDGQLTIKAERIQTSESNGHSEFSYGSFVRTVALPAGADEDDIHATYDRGILTVSVPLVRGPPDREARRGHRDHPRRRGRRLDDDDDDARRRAATARGGRAHGERRAAPARRLNRIA